MATKFKRNGHWYIKYKDVDGKWKNKSCGIKAKQSEAEYLRKQYDAKELNNYVYSDKTSKLYVDDFNQALDAIRYNVVYHLDNPNKGKYYVY